MGVLKKKFEIFGFLLLFGINFLIFSYIDGNVERYKYIKYLIPERGVDIALSLLNIAVVIYLLINIVLDTIEVKEFLIIRVKKKGFNQIILRKWAYLTFLLLICNAGFEIFFYKELLTLYLMLSYLTLFLLFPVFLKFIKTDYYFVLCMLFIFLTHVAFYVFL